MLTWQAGASHETQHHICCIITAGTSALQRNWKVPAVAL